VFTSRPYLWILRKEILEGIRDRNTILYTILVPVFLYPVLFFFMIQIGAFQEGRREARVARVRLEEPEPTGLARFLFEDPGRGLARDATEAGRTEDGTLGDRALLREPGGPDLIVRTRPAPGDSAAPAAAGGAPFGEPPLLVELVHASNDERSVEARRRAAGAVDAFSRQRAVAALRSVDLDSASYQVVDLETVDLAGGGELGRFLLSFLLPMILIMMVGTGTFYAAIDVVVGERERSTVETTLLAPCTRGQVLLGKYLFVVISGLVAGGLNLLSMTVSAGHLLVQLDPGLAGSVRLPWDAVLLTLLFATLLAAFLAAVMMVLSVRARNYKEGQSHLTPFYFLTLFPAMASVLPGVHLTLPLAFIPVLDVSLAFKGMIAGRPAGAPEAVSLLVMVALCVLALAAAARVSRDEDVYFGAERPGLGDLVRSALRPRRHGAE
jgi:sodium transport system permease protein